MTREEESGYNEREAKELPYPQPSTFPIVEHQSSTSVMPSLPHPRLAISNTNLSFEPPTHNPAAILNNALPFLLLSTHSLQNPFLLPGALTIKQSLQLVSFPQ